MKSRRFLSLLLCLCMALTLLPTVALAADSEGEFKEENGATYYYQPLGFTITDTYGNVWDDYSLKYKLDDTAQTATLTAVSGPTHLLSGEETLRVLDKITYQDTEYTVTTIGEKAFYYCSKVKAILLPETITEIQQQAFDHCENAETINIPQSVTSIGFGAFNSCTKLKEIRIPDGITEIPSSAFQGCWAVSSLTIPGSVTTIGESAFSNLGVSVSEPMDLVIPNTVTYLGTNAFRSANIRSVVFPAGRTETLTLNDPFPACSNLERIEILTDLVTMKASDFRGCASTAVVLHPLSVTQPAQVPTRIIYLFNEDGETVTIRNVLGTALEQTPAKIGDWYVSAILDTAKAYQSEGKHVCYFGENNALKYCTICGAENENHTHDWTGDWLTNKVNHWHECTCGEKADQAAHTFTWVVESETAVSETGHEECDICGYGKTSEKRPTTAPTQPTYDDLSNGDSDHTAIHVILQCAEADAACYELELKLLENGDGVNSYSLSEVTWDSATQRWYCDVTIHSEDYIEKYSKSKNGRWTLHELAGNETATKTIRFWYKEEFAVKGVNPWRTEGDYYDPNGLPERKVVFQLVHTEIPRTIICKAVDITKSSVELSADVSQLATEWEIIYYAMSDTPDAVPADMEFSFFSSFEDLKPDTTYYFWAKVKQNDPTGLLEAVSQPISVTTSHDWDTAWSGDDTHHWHACTAEGCTLTDNSQKLGYGVHTGGTATCHTKAVCGECGKEYGAFDADNHEGDTEVRDIKAATCTEDGYTGDTYCLGCGEKIADGSVIPATGHTLTHHERIEATCTTAGSVEYWSCTACGKNFSDINDTDEITDTVIPKIDHIYASEWKSDDTNHWHECVCGAKADESTHRFKWVIDKEATETENGSKHEECQDCGYKKEAVEIPASGGGGAQPSEPPKPVEPDKPTNPDTPQTGDTGNLLLWFLMLILAGSGLTGTVLYRRKKNRNL